MVLDAIVLHPLEPVTVTVYVVVAVGVTVMDEAVASVLHEGVPPPLAASVALCPGQMASGDEMETVGLDLTVTLTGFINVQPLLSVTVTV